MAARAAIFIAFMGAALPALAQQTDTPPKPPHVCNEDLPAGFASTYSDKFYGRKSASGEILAADQLTAAHLTVGFDRVVEVTDTNTKKTILVKINDRGPHIKGRVIDLTRAGYEALGHTKPGLYRVTLKLCR